MKNVGYQVSESAIYKKFSEELIVIQVETGKFYYFSSSTESLLNFFKTPQRFEHYLETIDPSRRDEETVTYLEDFCDFLLQNKILRAIERFEDKKTSSAQSSFEKPQFLRKGEKNLEDLTLLCP